MLASVFSCLLRGLEGRIVEVQVDIAGGMTAFHLVGLAAGSLKEARDRVRSAIRNSMLPFPTTRLTVNLAPAEVRKEGSGLDLAIAVGIALAGLRKAARPQTALLGELALDGQVRHVNGVLVAARALRACGFREVLVPAEDAAEAALAGGLAVYGCRTLTEAVGHVTGEAPLPACVSPLPQAPSDLAGPAEELAEVRGQEAARRALEVAAAGGHHLLLTGPPGAGKTMLARCLTGILPWLTLDEALEVAQVRSVLGDLPEEGPLDWESPFRSPHHSISTPGLVGGGSGLARPGEITRAHRGVLFLDELAEFSPATLQALRQPIEQGRITITRAGGNVAYPAEFMLVAATNPCPCGWYGDHKVACRCSPAALQAYQRALSGPLLDRIDLQVPVTRPQLDHLTSEPDGERSCLVRLRVAAARRRQLDRQGFLNAALKPAQLRLHARLEAAPRRALMRWAAERGLTARGLHRTWRVARTIADLEGVEFPAEPHVLEALGYRLPERAA